MNFEKLNPTIICHNCGGLGETFDTKNGTFVPCFIEDSEIKISRREIHNSSNGIDLFYSDDNSSGSS